MNARVIQAKTQKFGSVLSAMVMPNIGVFIGWGVLTALFIDTGWYPDPYWKKLVEPVLKYLMPTLIGYTAGHNLYGRRGGVIGAFATMGAVVGADVIMLIGGMILGPLAAWILKKFDGAIEGKVKPGMEMMVDNFSLGLIGLALCMLGYAAVAPIMTVIQTFLGSGVNVLIDKGLLPLVSIFVQPGQTLFLNNAINHGIMIPLGIQQAAEMGKSVLFLVEGCGADWVGLALAFAVFGKGTAKKSAPGAALIMFFGGIAEVCFPYCLMMPITILGPIAGNTFALFIATTFGGGTVGAISPGSVLALFMMSPKDSMVVNAVAYFGSLIITFIVTGAILKFFGKDETEPVPMEGFHAGTAAVEVKAHLSGRKLHALNKVIFACDAGMGSSAMGVSILKTRMQKAGLYPNINHVAVAQIPLDADVVVTNVNLVERAKMMTDGKVPIVALSNFMDQKEYDRIVSEIQGMLDDDAVLPERSQDVSTARDTVLNLPLLPDENIILGASFSDRKAAIAACADVFIRGGYASKRYKADMLQRDEENSVYMGNGVALPHGLDSSKQEITASGICFIQVPEGVPFDGEMAYLLIGVAGRDEEHVELLGQIANTLCVEENIQRLRAAKTKQDVKDILQVAL